VMPFWRESLAHCVRPDYLRDVKCRS